MEPFATSFITISQSVNSFNYSNYTWIKFIHSQTCVWYKIVSSARADFLSRTKAHQWAMIGLYSWPICSRVESKRK